MRRSFLFLFLILFLGSRSYGQSDPVPADTTLLVEYAFIPALSFNSDFGLIFGGLINRYDYSKGYQPYSAFTGVNALISTEGLFLANLNNDFPNFLGKNIRLTHFLSVSQFLDDNFFGIAQNDKLFPSFEDDPELYTFNSFSIRSELQFRKAMQYYEGTNRLEFLFTNIFNYETPFDTDVDMLISQVSPLGFTGGSTNLLLAGFILERRDDEIRPTKGTFTKVMTGPSIKNLGSKYNLYQSWVEQRSYVTVNFPFEMTFANRLIWSHSNGDTPYWALPRLGGENNLRGFPDKRFMNENYIVINTEVRKWLGRLPFIGTEWGGAFFLDAGRSFSNDEFDDLFSDIHVAAGFSGLLSLFTEDFFLRGDFGFSKEGTGVYIGIGFLF